MMLVSQDVHILVAGVCHKKTFRQAKHSTNYFAYISDIIDKKPDLINGVEENH